ncbi:GTP-binding protein [Frankia sp. CcWB2]
MTSDRRQESSRRQLDAARRRAEIRAFIRTHHPDRGGDPQAFAAGLRALRSAPDGPAGPDALGVPGVRLTTHHRPTAAGILFAWVRGRGRRCPDSARRWWSYRWVRFGPGRGPRVR